MAAGPATKRSDGPSRTLAALPVHATAGTHVSPTRSLADHTNLVDR